jgi:hypothetical protein
LDDHRSWNVNGEDKQPFPRKGKNTQQVDLSHACTKRTTKVSEQVFLHLKRSC